MTRSSHRRGSQLTRAQFLSRAAGAGAALALGGLPAVAAEAPLITRKIPKSGEAVPVVGLGTALSFGYAGDQPAFDARKTVIRTLLDGGGSVIDTSPTYGSAEAVVGRALAELAMRDKAFIATKISIHGEQAGIDQHRGSVHDLRIPVFDLLQIHNLRDTATHLKTVRRLKEEGRVRYIGITHFRPSANDRLAEMLRAEPLDFVQLRYSIASREAENVLLPLARDRGVAVMVNVPFERGRLFRLVRGRAVPDWAQAFGARSWGQFFLKFLFANPAVTVAIPGTTKPRHMRDNLAAARGRLPDRAETRRMTAFMATL